MLPLPVRGVLLRLRQEVASSEIVASLLILACRSGLSESPSSATGSSNSFPGVRSTAGESIVSPFSYSRRTSWACAPRGAPY